MVKPETSPLARECDRKWLQPTPPSGSPKKFIALMRSDATITDEQLVSVRTD
jgi:hypothetical protein